MEIHSPVLKLGASDADGDIYYRVNGVLTRLANGIASNVYNLKLVVNAAVNKLDVFTRTGGAVPDANNVITVAIPDGNGNVARTRAAAYLSGTSQFIMADAANYWSKGSLDAEIKTAYVYAIWDANGGIVWALGGYAGFTRVPASTTATDDDFFLLEASSTYTKVITDYCVCVGKIRYEYDTADTPDHTIQATVLDAPQIMWNPKSDYSKTITNEVDVTSGSDIAEFSYLSTVVKQPGKYFIALQVQSYIANVYAFAGLKLRCGSATYGSATQRGLGAQAGLPIYGGTSGQINLVISAVTYLNAGDTIHLGASCTAIGGSGNRYIDEGVIAFFRCD